MKREILFRGKRADNGEWVDGYLVKDPQSRYRIYWQTFAEASSNTYHFVIPETVEQFTGLTDKNGAKIFEGDIVKGISNSPFSMGKWREYVVIWGVDHWHIKDTHFTLQELFNHCNDNIEVIGHIHDNPELINK